MTHSLTPDALKAMTGKVLGVSAWQIVDQPLIDRFADVSGDHTFIHVDAARAAQTAFGTTIAHGMLTLSLVTGHAGAILPDVRGTANSVNYGFNRVRFLSPVRRDQRIRTRFRLTAFEETKPGQYLWTLGVTVEIEAEDRPALVADWLILSLT